MCSCARDVPGIVRSRVVAPGRNPQKVRASSSRSSSEAAPGVTVTTSADGKATEATSSATLASSDVSTAGMSPVSSTDNGTYASCNILNNGGALDEDDYAKFVQFFRQASPYIAGHR